ncbi:MAG: hypothetical protein EXS36_00820 [Pedosphaera sp.]|nr:hypothetical protein [Pedosphaera sp.]
MLPSCQRVVILLTVFGLGVHPTATAQSLEITGFTRQPTTVTLDWKGGHGPYRIETSRDLLRWSEQGEPETARNHSIASFGDAAAYRVIDLNAEDKSGPFFGLIQSDQGEFGDLMARHRLKFRWWLHKPLGTLSTVPATFFRQLFVHTQFLEDGLVKTRTGTLESIATLATPGNAKKMTATWTRGERGNPTDFCAHVGFSVQRQYVSRHTTQTE